MLIIIDITYIIFIPICFLGCKLLFMLLLFKIAYIIFLALLLGCKSSFIHINLAYFMLILILLLECEFSLF